MLLLLLLVLIYLIGYLLINLIYNKASVIEKICLGYISSIGLLTFSSFILNLYQFPFSKETLFYQLLCSLIITITLNFLAKKQLHSKIFKRFTFKIPHLTKYEKIALLVTVALSSLAIISSLYWPVKDWDSIVLYDFRAKTFVATGHMDDGINRGYFFGYPLLTSIAHSYVYFVNFQQPGIIHSLFYVSFLGIVYSFLKKQTNKKWSIIWTTLIAMSPGLYGHAQMTYTNISYVVYLVSAFIYLHLWLKNKNISTLIISALLLGLSTWSRSTEPFWMILILISFIGSIFNKKLITWIIYPIIVYLIRIPWLKFEEANLGMSRSHIANSKGYLELLFSNELLTNILPVIIYFYKNVILQNIFLYLSFFLILYLQIKNFKNKGYFELIIFSSYIFLSMSLIFLGILLFSLFFSEWQDIGGSAQRMSMFIPPLILLLIAQFTYQKK